jgi:hypothetical protein
VFSVRYELGFYIPEDGILHSHSRENLKSYITLLAELCRGDVMSPVRYELGFVSQKTPFFIVTAVKPQILHNINWLSSVAEK